jgi:hypothetical protein
MACFSPTFKHGKYAQARTANDKAAYQIGKSQLRFGLSQASRQQPVTRKAD